MEVDATGPVPAITSPTATSDTTPTIAGTAGTAPTDASTVTVRIWQGQDTTGVVVRVLTATRAAAGGWSVDVAPALPEGLYTVRAEQSDSRGNTGSSNPRGLRVDVTAPDVGVSAASPTEDTTPELSGRAGDAPGDASRLLVRLWPSAYPSGDAAHELLVTRDGGAWRADAPALGAGEWTAVVWQDDNAGNRGAARHTFTVVVKPLPGPPPATPQPTPAAPTPPPGDERAPAIELGRLPAASSLAAAAYTTGAFSFPVSADESATVTGELLLGASTARALGLKLRAISAARYVVLGKGRVKLTAGKGGTLKVALSKTTRRRLAKAPSLRLVLRLTATDAAANRAVMRTTLRVKRPKKR